MSRDALQGLLRRLGAGFEDILPSGGMSSAQLKVQPQLVLPLTCPWLPVPLAV